MKRFTICFDGGGTTIHAGVVTGNGDLLIDSISSYSAKAKESKEIVMNHLFMIIKEKASFICNKYSEEDIEMVGIGLSFPGPFQYEDGTCLIKGLDKFESLYGVNVKKELEEKIHSDNCLRNQLSSRFVLVFENDARLFALGEYEQGKAKGYSRIICLTLGTGLGSSFIENGEFVKGKYCIPESGEIFNVSFKGDIIDNLVSRRGILKIAREVGFDSEKVDVKELADLARSGSVSAKQVFQEFGSLLGEALQPFIEKFSPEIIVLGGQISRSYDLFEKELHAYFPCEFHVEVSENPLFSTMFGAFSLVEKRR
jgi:glucokinase